MPSDTPLTETRVDEIRARLNAVDCPPWKVYKVLLTLNEVGQREFEGMVRYENRIGTAYDHPQCKAPAPIITTASRPYHVERIGISMSDSVADFVAHAPEDIELLLADRDRLVRRVEELEAALKPFATFARQWDRMPLRNMDGVIYAIHVGTEYEAELSLNDMHRAAALTPEAKP